MNTDEYPDVAAQLGVQSIPAVFAFKNGQPVDGFMGALSESQVRAFIQRVLGSDAGGEAGLEDAQAAFAAGDVSGAAAQFAAILQADPENVDAVGGLAKCYIQTGDLARAEQTLGLVPPAKQTMDSYRSAKAALDLAKKAGPRSDTKGLEQAVATDPRDWESRFKLALALNGRGQRREAMDHLLEIVRKDRTWNDDAARKQLIELFDAWGPKDSADAGGEATPLVAFVFLMPVAGEGGPFGDHGQIPIAGRPASAIAGVPASGLHPASALELAFEHLRAPLLGHGG